MRKNILALSSYLLTIIMIFSMTACSSKRDSKENEIQNKQETSNNESKGSSSKNDNEEKTVNVTLEFQQWWGVELPDGALQKICDDFTKDTGVKIKLLSNPYADTKTQIAAGAAAGTMADVVGLDGSWVYDFAKQGAIANLTQLMKDDGYDDSQLSDQIKVDGNTYMIPVVNFVYPLYVNMDLMKKANITEMPKTWKEFLESLEKVKNNTDASGFVIPLSTEAPNGIQNQFMSWLWASGGSMLKDGNPNLVDNEKLSELLVFVKTMKDNGYISKGAEAMKEQDMVNEFINGRLAFMVDGISHLTLIKKENPDLNFDYINMPVMDGYDGKSGLDVANWGIGIAENCKNKEEALKFVEYLMSPEVNAKLAQLANAFPGNSKATPDYSQNDDLFKTAFNIFQEGYAINEFTGAPTSEDLMRSFNEKLILYLEGDIKTPDDMLSEVQIEWMKSYK